MELTLKEIRLEKGLSLNAVSILVNINKDTLAKAESGESNISLKSARMLSEFYGITLDEMDKAFTRSKKKYS